MSSEVPLKQRKLPIAKLAIAGALLVAVGVVLLLGVEMRPLLDRVIDVADTVVAAIREAGAFVFFAAMAVLPALGAPLSVFSLAAGEAFAPQFTMTGVVLLAMIAIAANQALTYWLARYALRPVLARLVERYGYRVPRVNEDNALTIALVVRLTPGPPYFMQGYLLGLAEVPFRLYMIVSWLVVLPWTIAFVVLGKAAREGNFGKIVTVLGVLVLATVLFQFLRRKFAKREA
jgi:uncharacterized membrane protein YdjX (TVP38/TMEM64 family)